METKVAPMASVREAFTGLIDYAGLFPPAKLTIADAAAEYRSARAGPHAWMLGRFIIPVTVLALSPHAVEGPFSVILDAGLDGIEGVRALRGGVRIEALEVAVPATTTLATLRERLDAAELSGLPVYVEFTRPLPPGTTTGEAVRAALHAGYGAKLRCGGVRADAFPSVEEVVDFVVAASMTRVPFKATAGLHHPVRHLDAVTGFTMHGFLNLLAAAALAPRVDREALRRVVAEEDATAFRFEPESFFWRDERIDAGELAACRANAFVAYGSCSFSEPVEDLTALGILPAQ